MVEVNATLLIALMSVICSIISVYRSGKKQDTDDVARRAAENATVNTKLDQISSDVKDIKYDITTVKKDVARLDKEMAVVQAAASSAHKRLDAAGIGSNEEKE